MTRPEGSHTCRGGIKRPVWRPWTWPTPHLDGVAGGIRARVLAESQAFEGIGGREAANFAGEVGCGRVRGGRITRLGVVQRQRSMERMRSSRDIPMALRRHPLALIHQHAQITVE